MTTKKNTKIKIGIYTIIVNDGLASYESYLDLEGTDITSLPDNLTVGGYLDLRNTGITSLPDNLTVGGHLYLEGTALHGKQFDIAKPGSLLSWRNGKYIKVDGMFTEVLKAKGNVYKVRNLNSAKAFFVITDGAGKYAHGESVSKAKTDLIYKLSGDESKESYRHLTLESILPFEECITFYRVITGACSFGVREFIESSGIENRTYSIAELVKLTKGRYGSEALQSFLMIES